MLSAWKLVLLPTRRESAQCMEISIATYKEGECSVHGKLVCYPQMDWCSALIAVGCSKALTYQLDIYRSVIGQHEL